MAKCCCCGKEMNFSMQVSHSHRRTNRTVSPNIQKVRVKDGENTKKVSVCTKCLKSGKVTRAI